MARALLLAALLLPGCRAPADAAVRDLAGAVHAPLHPAPGTLHVLVFVTTDCPIANAYAPTIRALADTWRDAPVRTFVVHVDPEVTAAAAAAHAADYGLPAPILLDPAHALARPLGITATPEAAVLDAHGLRYRGRIDDAVVELGGPTRPPAHAELRDAVAALLRGEQVAVPRTEPVGCLLPEPRR